MTTIERIKNDFEKLSVQETALQMLLEEQKLLDPARSPVEQAVLRLLVENTSYLTPKQIHECLPEGTVELEKLVITLEMMVYGGGLLSRISRGRRVLYALSDYGEKLAQKLPPPPS